MVIHKIQEKLDLLSSEQPMQDLLDALGDMIDSFKPVDYDTLSLPQSITTRGHPKTANNHRLPSSFEIKDKEDRKSRKRKAMDNHHKEEKDVYEFPLPKSKKMDPEHEFLKTLDR